MVFLLQFGYTPLPYAANKGRTGTVRAILAHPAVDINVANSVRVCATGVEIITSLPALNVVRAC